MSGLVLPVIPSSASPSGRRELRRNPLPLASFPLVRERDAVYGLCTLGANGRISDRALLAVLGWVPGTRLGIWESGGLLVVSVDPGGVFGITAAGHLMLPSSARRWVRLRKGDRVLLVANPSVARLIVHPPVVLDAMVAPVHEVAFGGEVS
ncbi:hypothetical protein ACIA8K_38935 [Catenuloplanes sp. NPDC051500]|uniref:hypothetical protein n=1 Tax=Catenuloplanes sp. NPDC051500 TaxID=3363959 RepID=UPI00379C0AB3